MTLGDGIFWSTIILVFFISVVLITKNRRWKTFLKILAIAATFGIVIGGGYWGYTKYENLPEVESSLHGIQLGMREVDVTLRKGEPDEISEIFVTPKGFHKFMLFNGASDSSTYAILRGTNDHMIVTEVCDKGGYGKVTGLGVHSSEEAIIEKLGKPSNISINEKGTQKLVSYPQWNAVFEFKKGRVTKVCTSSRSQMEYITEYNEKKMQRRFNEGESKERKLCLAAVSMRYAT